jgi:Na+/melibiose symporter-like transporter
VAGVLLVVFVFVQRARDDRAMLDLSLFRNPTFVALALIAMLANIVGPATVFLEANFVQNVLRLSPWETGLRFLPLTATILVFGAIAGLLTTRVPMRLLFFGSLALMAVGLGLTLLATEHSTWIALLPSMLVMGVAIGLFGPPRAAAAIGVTEPERAGMASGINETFQQVGVAIGIAAIGSVFENAVADRFAGSSVVGGIDAHAVGRVVASGAIDRAVSATPAAVHDAVRAVAERAFVGGLHVGVIALAVLSAVGALIGLFFVRNRDLHASALTGLLPELDESVPALSPASSAG